MHTFAALEARARQPFFEQVATNIGISAEITEKDFWVCWSLQQLFGLNVFAPHLTFKGGTSLSKVYGIIDRFSEDIDLIIDRKFLGAIGDKDPEAAASKKQRKKRIEILKESCRAKVATEILPALAETFGRVLPAGSQWRLSVADDDPDVQTVIFEYPTCWPNAPAGYVKRVVRMEMGARSDDWPATEGTITPFVAEQFPSAFTEPSCKVNTLAAERTFLEKAALLHEEQFRPREKPLPQGLSRHYYDLYRLIEAGVADRAIEDPALFERVVEHRKIFFGRSWIDYSTMEHGKLSLIPSKQRIEEWRDDYKNMEQMFFTEPPSFDDLLAPIRTFERRFNGGMLH